MPVESVTHIADLDASNPVGSTDKVQTLDDHIRNIKTALKTDINFSGALTVTHTQLNVAGTLLSADQGADKLYGWDESANAAIAFALSTGLTTSGTNLLIDTSVVPRLNVSNTFTGATLTVSATQACLQATDSGVQAFLRASNASSEGRGGTFSNHDFSLLTNSTSRVTISAAGAYNFRGGAVTTSNASASEVGKTGAPSRSITDTANTAASDQGGTIRMTGGSGKTFTLDSDIPTDCFVILVNSSGNDWTIAASGTLTFAGTTGSRTLPTGCMAVALSAGSGNYNIAGQLT